MSRILPGIPIKTPRFFDVSLALREFAVELNHQIAEQIKVLLEEKHLYQRVSVDPERVREAIYDETNKDCQFGFYQAVDQLLSQRLTPSTGEGFARAVSRNGEEIIELFLQIPNSRMFCTTCDERLVFTPIWYTDVTNTLLGGFRTVQNLGVPMEKMITHQLFFVVMQCQHCKGKGLPEGIIIRRDEWKFSLDGRSPMEHIQLPKYLPKPEGHLFRDALIAWHGGKKLAAVFYLRCFIEQFARRQTGLLNERKTGDEIMDSYANILPADKRPHLPSLKHCYDVLSVPMHRADEELAEKTFESTRSEVEQHFEVRQALRIPDAAPKVDASKGSNG